ncbi:hypothetical protein LTR86_005280 [Recurvomyces mirabilis]|nr:hypothetical protein LTR86_005280 [Recurvomyces mirabilis]
MLFEEELIADYNAKSFCNVSPGDLMDCGRYSIISKLGWGRSSTVWLAKDLRENEQDSQYVSIKFNNCTQEDESIQQERNVLEKLSTADPDHPGFRVVRKLSRSFEIPFETGTHLCLVHEPLRETLEIFRTRFANGRLPLPLVKAYVKILLVGLDYVHESCHIVHTDLKLDNIMVTFENESVLHDYVERLRSTSLPYKQSPDRRVYQSENNFGPMRSYVVSPVITDFGSAILSNSGATPIQPDGYRAPEVLLGWGWSSNADIWNLGHLIWRLASGTDLFTALHRPDGTYDAARHLAQMYEALGPPDPALIRKRSEGRWIWSPPVESENGEPCEDACAYYGGPFFDASGNFLHVAELQSLRSLHERADFVAGSEKKAFVDFIAKMLAWDPDARLNAGDLYEHAWLTGRPA